MRLEIDFCVELAVDAWCLGGMVKFSDVRGDRLMNFILRPWQLLVVILVGWVHREQQKIIEFYQSELDALLKAQGKKRLLLTDDQRRVLAD